MAISKKNSGSYGGGAAVAEPPMASSRAGKSSSQNRGNTGGSGGGGGDTSLSRKYGIDESNLALRRRFLRIDESDRELMMELAPWAKSVAAEVAREFYDWQFEFEPTLQFFENMAEQKGISLAALREHLEGAQTRYFTEVFEGANSNWGVDYFEKRLKVGKVHDRINLPSKWYIGSYGEYLRLLPKYLKDSTKDPVKALRAERVIAKIFNLDIQAIGDAFILSTIESTGFDLNAIECDGDKTECLGDAKDGLARLSNGVDALSKGDADNELLEEEACQRAGIGRIGHLAAVIRKFITEMNHMSDEHDKGDIDVRIPADNFEGAYREMAEGVNKMVAGHIDVKKKAIACVAELGKGNLDAPLEQFPGKKAFVNEAIETVRSIRKRDRESLERLMKDVDYLNNSAKDGHLSNRANAADHQGDFRRIAETINGILEILVDPLRSVAQNSQTLASSAEELSAVSQQMAGNAEETAMQANIVSAASEEVSANVGTVASGAEEMQASIREIAKNANEAARVAKNAVSVASQTNETISKLGESSTEIGNVIKVITSIAQQTNLLALNATIEAARAGEAGKGFAVVANEVKELAKQTAKATEEIGQKIEAIQGDTKGAVKAIAEISGIINQINDISNSIASAVEEQTVTTNEIGRSVAEAAKGTGDIAKNISGVAVAAKSTTQGASDTQKAAQELSRMAALLQGVVAKFQF